MQKGIRGIFRLGLWAWVVGLGTLPGVPALAGEGRFIQVGSANEEAQLEAIDRQLRKELEKRKAAEAAAAKAEAEARAQAQAQAKAKAEAEAKAKAQAQAKAKAEAKARAEAEQARVAEERAQAEARVAEERAQAEKRAGEFVAIKGGCFEMGSPSYEGGRGKNEGLHQVCVEGFKIGKYEVTQGEWQAVMGSNPSSFSSCGDRCPVENVSWNDVQEYIEKLNAKTGKKYRLPTEAEWEYGARAGTTTAYWWGNQASHEYANYGQDSCCRPLAEGRDRWDYTAPVGSFPPNPWGLYDTAGNVWEWTCSAYVENYDGSEKRCSSKNDASARRVHRGGSWNSIPAWVRSAFRYWLTPDYRSLHLGFRLAQGEAE